MRTVFVGVVAGTVFGFLLASCGPMSKPCSPTTCTGCCDPTGTCRAGNTTDACGSDGKTCASCNPTDGCTAAGCALLGGGTGGAGGGLACPYQPWCVSGGSGGGGAAGGTGGSSGSDGGSDGGTDGGQDAGGGAGGGTSGGSGGGAGANRLFVIAQVERGDFGTIAAADALCVSAAAAAGKPGRWKAFLSTASSPAIQRITSAGPWYQEMAGGSRVLTFQTTAGLGAAPLVPIVADELGQSSPPMLVWTGMSTAGATGLDCAAWTTQAPGVSGTVGGIGDTQPLSAWPREGESTCNVPRRFVCLED